MSDYCLKRATELFPELVEMNAQGVEFPLELRWALNRFQMHQWRGSPRAMATQSRKIEIRTVNAGDVLNAFGLPEPLGTFSIL